MGQLDRVYYTGHYGRMPNQPRADNPGRVIRIDDVLWGQAQARAKSEGTTVSDVVRRALEHYTKRGTK